MKVKFNSENLMKKAGVTSLSKLSDIVDVRRAALSELANGKRQRIEFEHIEKIAERLGIDDMSEIIELVEDEEKTT